ncbi:MAG TPA: ABC transporter substrate-binding protein [Stellaceae bacterium]|jgi:phospholipid transport system substrate-binding protein|nr:ABC transporter substrate-binding protein [Stellaceae bacterium]
MKRSMIRGRGSVLAAMALCLALAMPTPPALALGAGGADTVRSLYDTLLATMHAGPALGPRGRYGKIEPIVRRVFDIPLMTRIAVGPEWAGLNESQRQQVSQAFERYITAIYAERFDRFSGERLQVTGEQASAGGTIITSQITKSTGEPVNVNYLMRQNGGVWRIADVYLDGTISELATRRSEFAAILRSRGIDGLIEKLNTKANSLVAASAS